MGGDSEVPEGPGLLDPGRGANDRNHRHTSEAAHRVRYGHTQEWEWNSTCGICRRERQRSPEFLLQQRRWRRGQANQADLQKIEEIEQWLLGQR
jgi:hypothetical protein